LIVGDNIRVLRAVRKITQAQLADKVGIAQSTLCEMETGTSKRHSEETLVKIAAALSVDVADLWKENTFERGVN
jgi:transcriptional regulator with XRE-family HTH domain